MQKAGFLMTRLIFLTLLLNLDCVLSFASLRQFKRVSRMYLLSKRKSNRNFRIKLSFYNREKSNLGYKVMRKSPFLQSPFLQPRPTAERLNRFSYRSKIFYTEMVNVNRKTLCAQTLNLSRVMRKLDFCKNKGADYLRS